MRVVACGAVPVLDRAVQKWIRRQQLLHIGEFLFLRFYRLVVALQTDIEPVSQKQTAFLRYVRVVAVHAGSVFIDRGMLDHGRLQISDSLLVTFSAQLGNGRRQHGSLIGQMRRMAIQALG